LKGKWLAKTESPFNTGSHSIHNDQHVQLLYLPPNTTYMQPLDHDQGITYCMKRAYQKHLVCFFLQEIDRNIPAADITKWNILAAMHSVAMSWASNVHVVIQNCFAKCWFGTK
jgi:hypothetical protein